MNKLYDILYSKNQSCAIWIEGFFGYKPDWDDLTAPNLQKFKDFLLSKLSPNSVRTYIAELKAVINLYKGVVDIPCGERDLKLMKVKSVKTTHCHLTVAELKKLESLKGLKKRHQDILDIFLLQAWTGCRISDATNLTENNIQDGKLSYVSQKTSTFTAVPVKPLVNDIISRLPEIEYYDRSTFNRVISNLCKKVGITDKVTLYKSGEMVTGEKYKFISSHSARRSFATNLFEAGIAKNKIAYMMGHSNVAMTERYICSSMEITDDISEFFN